MPNRQNDQDAREAGQKQPWEERLREAVAHVEQDLRKLVNYINDDVMPDVRRNGSSALRSAAGELQRLAERMDQANAAEAPAPPRPKP